MSINEPEQGSPLGKATSYTSQYSPELLHSISRQAGRDELAISGKLPFDGEDLWTAYELSWLNAKGKPRVAMARFLVPCESSKIIESKSFKLYLNSFSQTPFESEDDVISTLKKDLSRAADESVKVNIFEVRSQPEVIPNAVQYECIDHLDIAVNNYALKPGILKVKKGKKVKEKLVSHLFKSNCPVTGQPDWASIFIDYSGDLIQHDALLKYIISYRSCAEFHEQCIERVFIDILRECQPENLTVQARFLRRGGLDINPVRSTQPTYEPVPRVSRQ